MDPLKGFSVSAWHGLGEGLPGGNIMILVPRLCVHSSLFKLPHIGPGLSRQLCLVYILGRVLALLVKSIVCIIGLFVLPLALECGGFH